MIVTDKELFENFLNLETRSIAFNQIVRKYQKQVYYLIRRIVIDHDDANDIVQDTFIKVYQALPNFRGDSQLYTWLYRIATNESLNFLKKKRRKYFIPIYDVEKELTSKVESGHLISGDEIQIKLQKAILKLPEKQRVVFNLKYFDELKYEDMAEILQTSVGALKASYHHAVKKIEQYINED
ncbi:MAG: sigma-70 family RNA polymerase sigma factor [Bacteroidota bacterium]|nr:sigma-70 family RNA polymerase sigma factor [Bacteroidota bacterium]